MEIAQDSMNLFRGRLSDRQIELIIDYQTEQKPVIKADRDRLRQVFSNISENALRYADAPGSFQSGFKIEVKNLTLFFEDSGPGVPPAALPQ